MDSAIIRNDARSRFEMEVDGELCVLDYRLADGVFTIDHVGVPASVGGRGIAGTLVRTALDDARANGWRVIANCTYAAAWIGRHPAYGDLVSRA
jgi:uncharacterized protein